MKTKGYTFHSILENGHMIDGKHPIGSTWPTQWGHRKVVKNVTRPIEPVDHITQAEIAQGVQ